MPICIYGETVLFFAHIPKTGGSSIEAYLRYKGPLALFGEPKVDGIHRQHLTRAQLELVPDLPAFDHAFSVLRDPVSRIVSEYLWRSRPLKPSQRIARPFRRGLARRIKVRGNVRALTFAEWVPLVLDEAAETPGMRDNHMRPQVEFLATGDRLFAFENGLEPVFRWIDDVTDGQANASPERLKASTAPKPEVSDASRALIEEWYSADLSLLQDIQAGRSIY